MNTSEGLVQPIRADFKDSWLSSEMGEKIGLVREWINGTGKKLLDSQTSKPYNFDEASQIRKAHEQFEFKCMKALEVFAELCDYRKQSSINLELSELDFMVQSFVEKLNKRTFFVVSCYTYFRLVEELWTVLEELQKRAKEVDTYDGSSIKNAIADLEQGVEKCEIRLNGLAHELERLRIILKPSDPDYLGQLEDGFRDACRAATEATQSLKIRKLILKKHSKLLECEENVYESIGWIEELYENIEVMYQENCVGKNHLESEDLLKKHNDIDNQAKTTYAYCIQLLETYGKLCEADGRRLPRNVGLSKTRLFRIWPKLTDRLLESQARTETAKKVYITTDMLLTRVQEYLLELSRTPPIFDRKCGSPTTQGTSPVPNDQRRVQLDKLLQEFLAIKAVGLQLIDKLPKGLLHEDIMVNAQITDEVIRVIRLKLYTLWLKVREYEYALLGRNSLDNTTASELAPDWRSPRLLSRSSNSTMRRVGSLFDGDFSPVTMASPQVSMNERKNRPSNPLGNNLINHNGSEESDDRGQCDSIGRQYSTFHLKQSNARASENEGVRIRNTSLHSTEKPLKAETSPFNPFVPSTETGKTKNNEGIKHHEKLNGSDTYSNHARDDPFNSFKRRLVDLTKSNQTRDPGHTVTDAELAITEHDKTKLEANQAFDEFKGQLNLTSKDYQSNAEISTHTMLTEAKNLLDNWTAEWVLQRENLNYRLAFLNRLEDLHTDLGECISRLDQLIKATCLSVNAASESYTTSQQKSNLFNKLGATVLSESEIYQMNTINDEVKGMLQTIPAQEEFIHSLILEVESCEKFRFPDHVSQIKSIWKKYTENLNIFKYFIQNLIKAYNIIPELDNFRSNYLSCVSDPNKQRSPMSSGQIDGHNLEQAIITIIKPDCLSPHAEQMSRISPIQPQVSWLIQYLSVQLSLIKESQEELDMLMLNMRMTSSSPVDLSELVRKSGNNPTSNNINNNNNNSVNQRYLNHKRNMYEPTNSQFTSVLPSSSDISSSVLGVSRRLTPPLANLSHLSFPGSINSEKYVSRNSDNNKNILNESSSAPPVLYSSWRIIKPLNNIQCKLGEMIQFQCYFNGPSCESEFSISWFYRPFQFIKGQLTYGTKECINLTNGSNNNMIESIHIDFVELMIKNVATHNAGLYTVRIKNEQTGKAMKSNASLTITPSIADSKSDVEAEIMDSSSGRLKPISITVNYDGLCLIPSVKWLYNGSPLNQTIWHTDTDMNRSILFASNAHISDEGVYECEVTDLVTYTKLRTKRYLRIKSSIPVNKQSLVLGSNNKTVGMVFVGDSIAIRCPIPSAIKSGSNITVDWLHNHQVIYSLKTLVTKQNVNKVISSKLATFEGNQFQHHVQNTDEGVYKCRIKSNSGIYESTGSLTLAKSVKFSKTLPDLLNVSEGDHIKLVCCLEIVLAGENKPIDFTNDNGKFIDRNTPSPSSLSSSSPLPLRISNQWDQLSLQVNWYLNNHPLDIERIQKLKIKSDFDNGLATLSIENISSEHEGDYCCEVKSSQDTIRTCGRLVLKKSAPSLPVISVPRIVGGITKSPSEISVGQSFTLTADYISDSIPEVKWFKNDGELNINSSHFKIQTEKNKCILIISNACTDDTGFYTVKLTNSAGTNQEKTFIEVKSREVLEETGCNKEISSTPSGYLPDKSVVPEQLCVTQSSEKISKSKTIIYGPLDVRVNNGDTLRLFCILRQTQEPYFVHWTHNGQVLKNSSLSNQTFGVQTWANYPKNGFYMLELKSVNLQDKGFYGVIVSRVLNISGKIVNETQEEAVCWVEVDGNRSIEKKAAPSVMNDGFPSMIEVTEGQMIHLECKVVGNPLPSYFWLKDGDMITTSNDLNFQMSESDGKHRLTLLEVTKKHSGTWDLVSYNSQGLLVKSCQLFVTGQQSNGHSNEAIKTKTSGTIINLKASTKKLQSNNSKVFNQENSIDQINKSPEGQVNSFENKSNQFTLGIDSKLEPPEFTSMFTDKVANAGETVCLRCCVIGNPKPVVQWKFNGKIMNLPSERIRMIHVKDEYSLIIYDTCSDDIGRYEITAENVIGRATCSALLLINSTPRPRHISPSSEPEYTTSYAEKFGYDRYNIHASRERCHSGTQTPEKKRSSLIRSISAPLSPLEPDRHGHNGQVFLTCRMCCAPIVRGYEDSQVKHPSHKSEVLQANYTGTYSRGKPWTIRRHKCSSGVSRRMVGSGTQTRLSRHRSEGSLLHQCPYCETLMLPVNPPNLRKTKPCKIERILSLPNEYQQSVEQQPQLQEEAIYYYQPNYKQIVVSHKTTRTKHTNITKTTDSHLPSSPMPCEVKSSTSSDIPHKSTSRPREIPIRIQRADGGDIQNKSRYDSVKSRTKRTVKSNLHSEGTVSVVESSDNDSTAF
ncbi:unnamed protein product [Heterobilharzia americana]|nr:unnamed protein product [Heterobilharzia americana]